MRQWPVCVPGRIPELLEVTVGIEDFPNSRCLPLGSCFAMTTPKLNKCEVILYRQCVTVNERVAIDSAVRR
jgi:hypothetical protein